MKSLGKGVVTWSYAQYRSNAAKEYNHIWRSLFREFIQNSNDAGATQINFTIDRKKSIIAVYDDGCGMTLDIIQNKLLVIGGSYKAEGSVGGLGKAKELLFFSHPEWTISTNDHTIVGQGGEYEIFENKDPLNGTWIELTQPTDGSLNWPTVIASLREVAGRCQIRAKITMQVDDDKAIEIFPDFPRGKKVRDIPEIGSLYYTKTKDGQPITGHEYIRITINGCWMFERYMGLHKGFVILDIDSRKLDLLKGLTANRDSLKHEYAIIVDKLVEELIIDKESAVKKREPTVTLIEGNGQVHTSCSDQEIMEWVQALDNKDSSPDVLKSVFKELDPLSNERATAFFREKNLKDDQELGLSIALYLHIMGYKPDFIIREDPDNDDMSPAQIQRFLHTQKSVTIAKVWTETVKQVLLDNQIRARFTAGFIFDRSAAATRTRDDVYGECYLINPLKVPPTGVQNKVEFMHYMRTVAIHEISHKFVRFHDEDFMRKYHSLEEKTWSNHRIYSNIGKLR